MPMRVTMGRVEGKTATGVQVVEPPEIPESNFMRKAAQTSDVSFPAGVLMVPETELIPYDGLVKLPAAAVRETLAVARFPRGEQ